MRRWKVAVVGVVGTALVGGTAYAEFAPGAQPVRPASERASWIRFGASKTRAPKLHRSEAGITLSVTRHVALQLHYERTAMAPMMRNDHDDGVLTRLRLAF